MSTWSEGTEAVACCAGRRKTEGDRRRRRKTEEDRRRQRKAEGGGGRWSGARCGWSSTAAMDISSLPNNDDPEKLLQLDVRMLPLSRGEFWLTGLASSRSHWQNRLYSQNLLEQTVKTASRSPPPAEGPAVKFVDRYMEKHITPSTLRYNLKRNPLYSDIRPLDAEDIRKSKPSWTIKEYDGEISHGNLGDYWKDQKRTPKDLDFWLEDLYTPGFDSLLKKKEEEERRRRLFKLLSVFTLSVGVILTIIVVPVLVLQRSD